MAANEVKITTVLGKKVIAVKEIGMKICRTGPIECVFHGNECHNAPKPSARP